MFQGREIENPNNNEIWKEMIKPDPEFAIYQHSVNLIGKMVISGREIENPNNIDTWTK